MRLLFVALFTALIVMASPAHAKTCLVPQSRADYETPEVQIYKRGSYLVACHRAIGGSTERVGVRFTDGMGTYDDSYVQKVFGDRWVWTVDVGSGAESADHYSMTVTNLLVGESVNAVTRAEDEAVDEAVGVPGGLISAGEGGVLLRFADGKIKALSADAKAHSLAVSGSRAYWRDAAGAPQTAALELPEADHDGKAPRAQKIRRCKPKRGARLLLQGNGIVVTRAGGDTWACSNGRTRRVVKGVAGELQPLGSGRLAYTRPGFAGVLDVRTGTRTELESGGGPLTLHDGQLVTAGPLGVKTAKGVISAEPATEVAASDSARAVYWLDATGSPRTADL